MSKENYDAMLYRIYIENKHYPNLMDEIKKYSQNFTVFKGEGYYLGESEHCLVIEIIVTANDVEGLDIDGLLYGLKNVGIQDCVLMVHNAVKVVSV